MYASAIAGIFNSLRKKKLDGKTEFFSMSNEEIKYLQSHKFVLDLFLFSVILAYSKTIEINLRY